MRPCLGTSPWTYSSRSSHIAYSSQPATTTLSRFGMYKKSKVYAYAQAYRKLAQAYEDEQALYSRLENSPLTIWQAIETAKRYPVDELPEALDRVEDEGLTTRQIRQPEEKNVETVTLCCCPKCGGVFPMSEAMTWTDQR